MIGATIIAVAFSIAFLGALIRPDSTPNSDNKVLRIANQQPGFEVTILKIRKNRQINSVFFWDQLLFGGQEIAFVDVPILNYRFVGTKIVVDLFSPNEDLATNTDTFRLEDVLFPVQESLYSSVENDRLMGITGDSIVPFFTVSETSRAETVWDMRKRIEAENLSQTVFVLGTDRFGRDMLSRLMAGTLISLSIGFIAVFIALLIGMTFGAISGFYGGKIDDIIMWFINVVWSVPTVLLVIAITLALGQGFWQIFVAVGLTMWVEVARVIRGEVISVRETEYIEAGRALGLTNLRLILRHVLPNVMGSVIVLSASNFAAAILIESGLSFLGIGLQPPMPSWGSMIKNHYGFILTDGAYLAILPGLAIMLLVLSFMWVGNAIRDAMDRKMAQEPEIGGVINA